MTLSPVFYGIIKITELHFSNSVMIGIGIEPGTFHNLHMQNSLCKLFY